MIERGRPVWVMTADGRMRPRLPLATRIAITAVLVAIIAGCLAFAALAFWIAVALIPVALIAALVASVAIRFQLWRARRSVGGQRTIYRP